MEKQAAHRVCKKGKPAIVVAGHKNTKKQINKMPGAMGLKQLRLSCPPSTIRPRLDKGEVTRRPVMEEWQAGDLSSGLQDGTIFFY
jgi:hypothetical protein